MFILLWFLGHHRPSISRKVSSVTNLKILFESHSAGTKAILYFWVWAKMRKNWGSHGVAWPFTGHQSMVLWLSESRLRESIDCWWHRRCRGERWWGSNRGWQHGHPPGQQSVCDLRAISVTPLGNGAPRRGIPSCAPFPPPRATPPSLLYQRCVGMAAQGRGKARQPNGPERLEGLMVWNAASKLCSGQQTSFALQSQGGPGYEFLTQPLLAVSLWRTAKTRFCNQATPPACLS